MKPKDGLLCASIPTLVCWVGHTVASQPLPRSTPFVAQIEKRFKKSDSDRNPSIFRVIYARKSDNSFVQIFDSKSPDGTQTELMSEIFDSQKAQHIVLEPFTKSAVILHYSAREYQQTVASLESENCGPQKNQAETKLPDVKPRTIFGRKTMHEVERISLAATTDSQAEWKHERYIVPELRCFSMLTIDRRSDGASTEEEVTSFQEGEPAASYFDVPSEYIQRSPRELNEAYSKRFGEGREFWGESAVKAMERRYQRLKANMRRDAK